MNKKAWYILSIISLLFLVPMLLAWFLYQHNTWLPQHKTNHGQLLTPPLSVEQLTLDPALTHHHWVLLYVHPGVCDSVCQKSLYTMQQIQRALGKDMNRVERVLLTLQSDPSDAALQQSLNTSGTAHWQVDSSVFNRVLNPPAAWYVVDPLGNIVLSYSVGDSPEWILDDLKHLMGVSNIG